MVFILFFFAHLFDKIKCFFVKLKNRAWVNDLKVTENSRNFFKHGFVKTKVFVLVTAPVGVVVAEDAFSSKRNRFHAEEQSPDCSFH